MTFSDRRIVKLVQENFVPAWESVAPVKVAVFDLGDGKTVRGTVGGEIALYFCRPDGTVFDILPALHSPHVTYWAIRNALDFYRRTGATDAAIREYHAGQLNRSKIGVGAGLLPPRVWTTDPVVGDGVPSNWSNPAAPNDLAYRMSSGDGGTRALSEMLLSKTGISSESETITVVEPGGLELYKDRVHQAMIWAEPRRPDGWKNHVFEQILSQELVGGEFVYDVDTLVPMSVIEED